MNGSIPVRPRSSHQLLFSVHRVASPSNSLSALSLFAPSSREGGGPISLIVGPLKGDEKEDDGEREKRSSRERDKKGDIDLISLGPRSPMVSMSLPPSSSSALSCPLIALFIYLLHPLPLSRIRRRAMPSSLQKSEGRSPHSLPFAVHFLLRRSFLSGPF